MATTEFELDVLIKELVTDFPPTSTDPVTFLGAQFDRFAFKEQRHCAAAPGMLINGTLRYSESPLLESNAPCVKGNTVDIVKTNKALRA